MTWRRACGRWGQPVMPIASAGNARWLRRTSVCAKSLRWHSDGSSPVEMLVDAAKVYDLYMDLMTESPHRHEMRFCKANIAQDEAL